MAHAGPSSHRKQNLEWLLTMKINGTWFVLRSEQLLCLEPVFPRLFVLAFLWRRVSQHQISPRSSIVLCTVLPCTNSEHFSSYLQQSQTSSLSLEACRGVGGKREKNNSQSCFLSWILVHSAPPIPTPTAFGHSAPPPAWPFFLIVLRAPSRRGRVLSLRPFPLKGTWQQQLHRLVGSSPQHLSWLSPSVWGCDPSHSLLTG